MPEGDPPQAPPSFMSLDYVDPLQPAKSDEEMQEEVIKRIKDFNMTIVAYGDDEILRNWVEATPAGHIIPAIGIDTMMSTDAFRDSISNAFYKVAAEFALQYQD